MDRGTWWAAVHGVAQSWTRLKRLGSSSSILSPEAALLTLSSFPKCHRLIFYFLSKWMGCFKLVYLPPTRSAFMSLSYSFLMPFVLPRLSAPPPLPLYCPCLLLPSLCFSFQQHLARICNTVFEQSFFSIGV